MKAHPPAAAFPEDVLSAIGLQLLDDLGPDEIQQRYFEGRTDGLRARQHSHVAWVCSQASPAPAADAPDPARS